MPIYEQPLNEKIRIFLRLELLVRRLQHHIQQNSQADTLAGLSILLDLYNVCARMDLKSDVIKEIDRLAQLVRGTISSVDEQDGVLVQLTDYSNSLYQQRGPLGQHLRSHPFFSQLRQRTSLPGGMNGVDIPVLNYWLFHDIAIRQDDLKRWGEPFVKTAGAASYILDLIRGHGEGDEYVAKEGFFQLSMPRSYQLMQVILPEGADMYPEISAGKQRFSLRFVEAGALSERSKQVSANITFTLKLCAF